MGARTIGTGALLASVALAVAACATPVTPTVRPSVSSSDGATFPGPSAAGTSSSPTPTTEPTVPVESPSASALPTGDGSGVIPTGTRPADTVPITKLAAGQRPPQFVVVSFDGACRQSLFRHYLDLGRATGARFTFFLSGLCIVPEAKRMLYHPPHKPVGTSTVGFASAANVPSRIELMTTAYDAGHEIGTHFLGHFCDNAGVGSWSRADWASEMAQAKYFLDHWKEVNAPLGRSLRLPFDSSDWKGDRTPCLQGIRSQMYPVFAQAGFSYDASSAGTLVWPTRLAGYRMWEFPLQRINVVGYGRTNLSMDYNLLVAQNGGRITATPAQCARIEESTYQSYTQALAAVLRGNRAPFFVGNHFNDWAGNAYTKALTRFVTDTSTSHPDVRFVTFEYLARWLDAQEPTVLAALRARPAPRY
jgi:peptidoglycan/xylan/chitin deacetylase (PgdA/CDA1 family)